MLSWLHAAFLALILAVARATNDSPRHHDASRHHTSSRSVLLRSERSEHPTAPKKRPMPSSLSTPPKKRPAPSTLSVAQRRAPVESVQMSKDSHATFFENATANGIKQKQAAAPTNNAETDSSTNNLEALERRTLKTIFYAACAAIGAALVCMYLVAGAYNKSKPYPPTPGVVPLFMDAGQEMNDIGKSGDNNSGQEGEQGQGNKEYGLNEEDFTYSLFSCHSEPILSAFSCLCMPIRFADTLRMAGMLPFSCAVALFALLAAVPPLFIGAAVFYRYQMRKLFKLPTSCWTIGKDCFFYSFCTCCSVIQEARQLEMAFRVRDAAIADVLAKNSEEIDEATEMQAQPSQNKMSDPLAAGREDAGNDGQEGSAG